MSDHIHGVRSIVMRAGNSPSRLNVCDRINRSSVRPSVRSASPFTPALSPLLLSTRINADRISVVGVVAQEYRIVVMSNGNNSGNSCIMGDGRSEYECGLCSSCWFGLGYQSRVMMRRGGVERKRVVEGMRMRRGSYNEVRSKVRVR